MSGGRLFPSITLKDDAGEFYFVFKDMVTFLSAINEVCLTLVHISYTLKDVAYVSE